MLADTTQASPNWKNGGTPIAVIIKKNTIVKKKKKNIKNHHRGHQLVLIIINFLFIVPIIKIKIVKINLTHHQQPPSSAPPS